jgi:molybdopterin-guanine dinucleotide biosynthesis protein B/molybdopterin-guanine dinucleotide biosynthesis protein
MHNSHNDITGVILAGGGSRRMGRDKAQLRLFGQPLWSRSRSALAALCQGVFVAGERPDLAAHGLSVFADIYPGSSLGGLHNALTHCETEWALLLPCDLPFPSPALLRSLLDGRDGCEAVVPRTERGIEPLVACYHRSTLVRIEAQLTTGDQRLTELLAKLRVRYLDEAELPAGWRRALLNLNRPEDLARLQSPPPAVTFIARSGTGKTTLLVKVIAELSRRGWTVGALKHDAHRFEIDHEGKDSWRMTAAGAAITAISSPATTAVIESHEIEPTLEQLLAPFTGKVDILLTEGFKRSALPKIEISREALQQPLLCRGEHNDPALLAVASDAELHLDVPCLALNAPLSICDFIEERFLR